MNYSKLKNVIKTSKLSQKEIANTIGMTENGLSQALIKGTLKISVLEKICDIIGVNPNAFFEEYNIKEINSNNKAGRDNNIANKNFLNEPKAEYLSKYEDEKKEFQEEIKRLNKELNACKDKMINLLSK
jgi:transcriptional regulator with XRE-family HTH domain